MIFSIFFRTSSFEIQIFSIGLSIWKFSVRLSLLAVTGKLAYSHMKDEIHPKYFPKAQAGCVCGAKYSVGSTKEKLQVEICSSCHPFYTGTEKVLDAAGRVERFKARAAKGGKKTTATVKTK